MTPPASITHGKTNPIQRGPVGAHHADILKLLESGPLHVGQICRKLNLDYPNTTWALRKMKENGKIVHVGKCGDHGFTDMRRDAPLYALPGTPPLRAGEKPKPHPSTGSGIIGIPCREREFKPLRGPDPKFERMRLCLETRR